MSASLTIISSMATRAILTDLAAGFQQATGRPVAVTSIGGVDAAKRVAAGELFDLVVLAADALQKLAIEGHVLPGSMCIFATSPTAVAVPAGAPKPATCDAASIAALAKSARAIGISTGPSGSAIRGILARSDKTLLSRIVVAAPGVPVAQLLARGDVDLGFQQLSELIGQPGIDIVGAIPEALLPLTTFSVGFHPRTGNADAVRALITWLTSLDAAAVKRRHGMEPEG